MQELVKKPIVKQFIKFGVIGFMGAIIDFGILNLLAVLFHFNVYFSAAISFALAATNNFYWNKKWTFRGQAIGKKIHIQYMQYLLIAIVGFFLNLLILRMFLPYFGNLFNLDINNALVLNLSKIIATLVVMMWNFIGSKKLVFSEKK